MPDSQNGILIELITEAMQPLGYKINKVYYPYERRIKSYQSKQLDAICDISEININNLNLKWFFSGNTYAYENYVYTLKKQKIHLTKISELSNYSMLSWQGAKRKLGREYEAMAFNNPFYKESHDQKLQIKMLFRERVDAIQMDKYIFEYYRLQVAYENEIDTTHEVDRFSLFGKNPNGFLFHSAKVRDDFIKQIALMKKDGRFDKIFNKYKSSSYKEL